MNGPNIPSQKGIDAASVSQQAINMGLEATTKAVEATAPEAAPAVETAKETVKQVAGAVNNSTQAPGMPQADEEDESYSYGMGF